jgi:hypothetical protein
LAAGYSQSWIFSIFDFQVPQVPLAQGSEFLFSQLSGTRDGFSLPFYPCLCFNLCMLFTLFLLMFISSIFYSVFDFEILMKNICQIKSLTFCPSFVNSKKKWFFGREILRLASGLKKSMVGNPAAKLWICLFGNSVSFSPGLSGSRQ